MFVSMCRNGSFAPRSAHEYALKQIEGAGISMSACREIAVCFIVLCDVLIDCLELACYMHIYIYTLYALLFQWKYDCFLYDVRQLIL